MSKIVDFDTTIPREVIAKITYKGVVMVSSVKVDDYEIIQLLDDTTLDELRELALEQK